jgi:hypothetical protein
VCLLSCWGLPPAVLPCACYRSLSVMAVLSLRAVAIVQYTLCCLLPRTELQAAVEGFLEELIVRRELAGEVAAGPPFCPVASASTQPVLKLGPTARSSSC